MGTAWLRRFPFKWICIPWSEPKHENGNRLTQAVPIFWNLCYLKHAKMWKWEPPDSGGSHFHELVFPGKGQNMKMGTTLLRRLTFSIIWATWSKPKHENGNRLTQAVPTFLNLYSLERAKTWKWEPPDSGGSHFREFVLLEARQNMNMGSTWLRRFPLSWTFILWSGPKYENGSRLTQAVAIFWNWC